MNEWENELEVEESDDFVADSRNSRFLSRADVRTPRVDTIVQAGRTQIDFGQGKGPEWKSVVIFKELKPWIVGPECVALIADILGTRDSREWAGRQLEVYDEPRVPFAGKVVGGIRPRAPRQRKNGSVKARREPMPRRTSLPGKVKEVTFTEPAARE